MNFLAIRLQISAAKFGLAALIFPLSRPRFVPADDRIAVVRARVNDSVLDKIMRHMQVIRIAAECKLQDTHSRQSEIVTQPFDFVRNFAEVFRYQRKIAERIPQSRKQILSRH